MGGESSETANATAVSQASEEDSKTTLESNPLTIDTTNENGTSKPQTLQNRPRLESIHLHIDEKIGCRIEEYKCQHNNFTGILYVGPLGVVFLGRFLLFEWTVVLKWSEVTKVKRKIATPTAFSSNNVAIRIETSTNDPIKPGGVYDFEGFFDPQKTLEQLIALHNDSLLDNDENNMSQIITKRGSVIPLRRSRSDPAEQISNIFNFDDDDESPIVVRQDIKDKTTILDLRDQYSATNKAALQKIASASSSNHDAPMAQTMRRDSTRNTKKPEELSLQQRSEEWKTVCSEIEKLSEVPVRDKLLVIEDLDAFVETFVGDSAPHSWSEFMTQVIGDMDVVASKWIESNDVGSTSSLVRTIEYTHPVNAPMAPPKARARKEQTLKRYGNENGLVVETKTIVSDVPMTDCFYVRDIIQVAKTTGKEFMVNIRFEIVFVKSTMFRALISRTTASEFNTFMTKLASWFVKHCGGETVDTSFKTVETTQTLPSKSLTDEQPPASTSESANFEFGWKLFAICLLVWMAQKQQQLSNENQLLREDLFQTKSTVLELESTHLDETKLSRDERSEWKSLLLELEEKRATEASSLRKDILEWNSALLEREAARATKEQSFREELLEWKSTLQRAASDACVDETGD